MILFEGETFNQARKRYLGPHNVYGYVYFIYNHDNNLYKIGRSSNMRHRFNCIVLRYNKILNRKGIEIKMNLAA